MREYEIVYIFRSSFTSEEIDAKLERYHSLITDTDGGAVTAVEQWGKRQLAYPIDKDPTGFYVVTQFTADPDALPELERVLKLDDDLLRHLIVLSEGELPIPPSVREEREAAVRRAEAEAARLERAEAQAAKESSGEAGEKTEGEAESDAEGDAPADAEEGAPTDAVEPDSPEPVDETSEETEAEASPEGDDDAGADESASEKEE